MGSLSDWNKLQFDENKKLKSLKIYLRTSNIINLKTIRYKLTALSTIIQSILNQYLMRPLSILRLHKE